MKPTRPRRDQLLGLLRIGTAPKDAAELVGVPRSTAGQWMRDAGLRMNNAAAKPAPATALRRRCQTEGCYRITDEATCPGCGAQMYEPEAPADSPPRRTGPVRDCADCDKPFRALNPNSQQVYCGPCGLARCRERGLAYQRRKRKAG